MSVIHKQLRQRGDTIVEVLIVLAVLGLAMSISYATATRSLLQAREAQENGVATALLQSQIERLRTLKVSDTTIFDPNQPSFCINDSNAKVLSTDPSCVKAPNSFKLAIQYCDASDATVPACVGTGPLDSHTGDDTFYFTAVWDNVRGEGTDTVSISYRMHK